MWASGSSPDSEDSCIVAGDNKDFYTEKISNSMMI